MAEEQNRLHEDIRWVGRGKAALKRTGAEHASLSN